MNISWDQKSQQPICNKTAATVTPRGVMSPFTLLTIHFSLTTHTHTSMMWRGRGALILLPGPSHSCGFIWFIVFSDVFHGFIWTHVVTEFQAQDSSAYLCLQPSFNIFSTKLCWCNLDLSVFISITHGYIVFTCFNLTKSPMQWWCFPGRGHHIITCCKL